MSGAVEEKKMIRSPDVQNVLATVHMGVPEHPDVDPDSEEDAPLPPGILAQPKVLIGASIVVMLVYVLLGDSAGHATDTNKS